MLKLAEIKPSEQSIIGSGPGKVKYDDWICVIGAWPSLLCYVHTSKRMCIVI